MVASLASVASSSAVKNQADSRSWCGAPSSRVRFALLQTNVAPYVISWGAIEALMYATRYVAFPDEVTAPFAGIAALIYALIVGRLIASIMRNLRELGVPVGEGKA